MGELDLEGQQSPIEAEFYKSISDKAAALSQYYNCEIHPLVFRDKGNNPVVGFLKEPPRIVKMRALDKSFTSYTTAGEEVLLSCLIKEASDQRIFSELPENDVFYIGASMEAMTFIKRSVNQFKKK